MTAEFNTPMMKQYLGIKAKYQDCLLLYRMGDFYELFLDDATIGAKILGITLTSRSKGKEGRIPMAGVPYHAVDTYLNKLVKAGYKVAICEQLSEPNTKGIVERDVIRIVTPGTIIDETALERGANNYIVAITLEKNVVAISCADLSTGEFLTQERSGDNLEQILLDELNRFHPAECILPSKLYADTAFLKLLAQERHMSISAHKHWETRADVVTTTLQDCFGTKTLAVFAIESLAYAQQTALALYQYLRETQKGKIDHIQSIKRITADDTLIMDRSTIINLELFSTIREHDTTGSLLQTIDQTQTAMGARLLKTWMCSPLRTYELIAARLESVDFFVHAPHVCKRVVEELAQITDIERILSRLSVGIGNARDLNRLKEALKHGASLRRLLEVPLPSLLEEYRTALGSDLADIAATIEATLVEAPPLTIMDGLLIQPGVDLNLDRLRTIVNHGDEWMKDFETQERKRTGISSLKVRYNSVFGYYIDVTKANISLVPDNYIRRQTLVNSERYTTPELKEHESVMLTAREEANRIEYHLYTELVTTVLSQTATIQATCSAIAAIDCLVNFAVIAQANRYVRPKLLYSNELRIQDGRHPVVERLLKETPFVPNSVHIDPLTTQLLIITGPNMAGKSVCIRQTALIVLMAHIGCFVPAASAHIGVVDRIFVRSGASDVITSGLSTFMVEMVETAHILHHATPKSLVIMDEIGRGTSTYDGISIAWAVATHLVTHTKAKTLFATHYHELQALEQLHPHKIQNYHMAVVKESSGPVFLHTLLPGGATSSYGIDVAKLAGIPAAVITAATTKMHELETRNQAPHSDSPTKASRSPIEDKIASLALSRLTPLEALNLLSTFQQELME